MRRSTSIASSASRLVRLHLANRLEGHEAGRFGMPQPSRFARQATKTELERLLSGPLEEYQRLFVRAWQKRRDLICLPPPGTKIVDIIEIPTGVSASPLPHQPEVRQPARRLPRRPPLISSHS